MRLPCENGHVRNLANFDSLIAKIVSYGALYQPSKESIQLEALYIVSLNARAALYTVNALRECYEHSFQSQEIVFDSLKNIIQSLFKALKVTASVNETEIYMLIGGVKLAPGKCASPQKQYDLMLDNFQKISKLLTDDWLEKVKLDRVKLEDFYLQLRLKNKEVKRNIHLFSNACLVLDEVMYRAHNGLVTLSAAVKMYIKYHYGWDSLEYKQIEGLAIKKIKS